jgi:hypothetical protein
VGYLKQKRMTTEDLKRITPFVGGIWMRIKAIGIALFFKVKYIESKGHSYLVRRTWAWLLFMPIRAVFMYLYITYCCIVQFVTIDGIKSYLFTDLDSERTPKADKEKMDFIKEHTLSDLDAKILLLNHLFDEL